MRALFGSSLFAVAAALPSHASEPFTPGNVLLRRTQYRRSDDPTASAQIARACIIGKLANYRTVLRRAGSGANRQAANRILRAADLEIDLNSHTVTRGGSLIDLTPTEFNLLTVLAEQPGRVQSRLQLLEATQEGTVYEGYERTIDAHIKNLRAKLEPVPKSPIYIETVFGVGYRFSKD